MPLLMKVDGPYKVPRTSLPGGWVIEREDIATFWHQCPHLAQERGCYVFAIRAGRAALPAYVGKATKSFSQEIFHTHKLNKYQHCMARTLRGTPLLYFVVAQRSRGQVNQRAIADCEFELINLAWRTNPDLKSTPTRFRTRRSTTSRSSTATRSSSRTIRTPTRIGRRKAAAPSRASARVLAIRTTRKRGRRKVPRCTPTPSRPVATRCPTRLAISA